MRVVCGCEQGPGGSRLAVESNAVPSCGWAMSRSSCREPPVWPVRAVLRPGSLPRIRLRRSHGERGAREGGVSEWLCGRRAGRVCWGGGPPICPSLLLPMRLRGFLIYFGAHGRIFLGASETQLASEESSFPHLFLLACVRAGRNLLVFTVCVCVCEGVQRIG